MPGKGGWTFARISGIENSKDGAPFGMIRVKGTIDGYELDSCSIMPMRNGSHFLPVNAAVRKHIKKEEGDMVHLILYKDDEPYKVPAKLQQRLEEEVFIICLLRTGRGNSACAPSGYMQPNALKL